MMVGMARDRHPSSRSYPQAALLSFRKWKNSTPSRSRRFIICGLRIISFKIDAIFDGRK
jgi:hypothetical protein